MTVCIAAIATDHKGHSIILTASDQRLSLYGGHFSQEGTAIKFRSVHPEWMVLFAGNASESEPLLEAVTDIMKKVRHNVRRNVVTKTRAAYLIERKLMVEREILTDYDIENYAAFTALRRTDPQLHSRISAIIAKKEENWNLLFAGFDEAERPHLFVIYERGKITYYNAQHFAAIGSGALAASVYLASYPYSKRLALGEAVFAIGASKFFAETASDVGKDTLVTAMRAKQTSALVLGDHDINNMREGWKALPKIPDGMERDLFNIVAGHLALYRAFPHRETRADGTIRLSTSEKSEPEK